jgi:hypothetical protein
MTLASLYSSKIFIEIQKKVNLTLFVGQSMVDFAQIGMISLKYKLYNLG